MAMPPRTFLTLTRCSVLFAALLSTAALPLMAQAPSDAWLKEVMARLALVTAARAEFTEQKFVKLLNAPLISKGTLAYQAPDRFEKITQSPIEEKMTVERDTVTLEQPARKKQQKIFIGAYPALAAIIDGMRGALSGNLTALQLTFAIKAEGNAAKWAINLVPLDTKQYAFVHAIRVVGKQDFIESIEIVQADGDRSLMTMTALRNPAERKP